MNQKIKSVKGIQVIYSMEDPSNPVETEWIETESFVSSVIDYDSNENIIKSKVFNHEQEVHEHYQYIFDNDNKLIEELCYFDEHELAEHKFITWNDKHQRIIEKIVFQEDGSENITHFTYDDKGLITEKRIVDQDDELEERDTYEYEGDKIVSERKFDYNNKLVHTRKFSYNKEGQLTGYEFTSADPYEYARFEYFYNETGEREKSLRYNHKNLLIEKILMDFDEKGNLIEQYEETQQSKKTIKYYYDENNNQVKQEEYDKNEALVVNIERTFNAENKLTESLVFSQNPEDGVQQMHAYRYEYEYWEE